MIFFWFNEKLDINLFNKIYTYLFTSEFSGVAIAKLYKCSMCLSSNIFNSEILIMTSFPFVSNSSCKLKSVYINVKISSLFSIFNNVLYIYSVVFCTIFFPING